MTPRLLFVTHSSRSGAPLMLLHFLGWLRQQQSLEFSVLARNGELADDFARLAPTVVIDPPDAGPVWRLTRRLGTTDGFLASAGAAHTGLERSVRSFAHRALMRDLGRRAHPAWADVVYLNSITSAAVLPVVPAGIPVITHVHELGHGIRLIGRQDPNAVAQMVARTDRFIAASQATADELAQELDVDPAIIDVCHEFIPIDDVPFDPAARSALRRELGIPPDGFVIGGVGRIEWRKGTDVFLQVAAQTRRLAPEGQPLVFLWVGPATDPRWQDYVRHDAQRLGLEEHVRFLGPERDASATMAALDAFVLTSRSDPFPLVCLEAAALARPVICFDGAGGMREFVEPADGLVPYLDIQAMAQRLIELIESPAEARAVGERLAERVRERHRLEVAAPGLLQMIRRVMAGGAAAASDLPSR